MADPKLHITQITGNTSDCFAFKRTEEIIRDKRTCQLEMGTDKGDKPIVLFWEEPGDKGEMILKPSLPSDRDMDRIRDTYGEGYGLSLKYFFLVNRIFYQEFGTDPDNPSKTANRVYFHNMGGEPREEHLKRIFEYLDFISQFLLYGEVSPSSLRKKEALHESLLPYFYSHADRPMFEGIRGSLNTIKKTLPNSPIAKRADWLLSMGNMLLTLWQNSQTKIQAGGNKLERQFKITTAWMLGALFANYSFEDEAELNMLKEEMFSKNQEGFQNTADLYHEIHAQKKGYRLDRDNFYAFLVKQLEQVKRGVSFDRSYQSTFQQRLQWLINAYSARIETETYRLLAKESEKSPGTALKLSLAMKYNHSPAREEALAAILQSIKIKKDAQDQPVYHVDMTQLDQGLRVFVDDWSSRAHPDAEQEAAGVKAALFLLTNLFGSDKSIKGYWIDQEREDLPSFYHAENIGPGVAGSSTKSTLEKLERDLLSQAETLGANLANNETPESKIPKDTLWVGGALTVAGGVSAAIPYQGEEAIYFGRAHSIAWAGAGVGLLGAGAIIAGADVRDENWRHVIRAIGSVAGGALATGIYIAVAGDSPGVTFPGTGPGDDPGRGNVDVVGP